MCRQHYNFTKEKSIFYCKTMDTKFDWGTAHTHLSYLPRTHRTCLFVTTSNQISYINVGCSCWTHSSKPNYNTVNLLCYLMILFSSSTPQLQYFSIRPHFCFGFFLLLDSQFHKIKRNTNRLGFYYVNYKMKINFQSAKLCILQFSFPPS